MPGLAPRATAWACRRRALPKLAPPFSFLYVAIQQSGSSYPLSLLKRASSGVVRMLNASFMTSSMVRLAICLSGRLSDQVYHSSIGRLAEANLVYTAEHPVLLSNDHPDNKECA